MIFNRLMKQSSAKQGCRKRGVVTYSPKNCFQIAVNKQFAELSFLIFIYSSVYGLPWQSHFAKRPMFW